jgi:hypothetical protein
MLEKARDRRHSEDDTNESHGYEQPAEVHATRLSPPKRY